MQGRGGGGCRGCREGEEGGCRGCREEEEVDVEGAGNGMDVEGEGKRRRWMQRVQGMGG